MEQLYEGEMVLGVVWQVCLCIHMHLQIHTHTSTCIVLQRILLKCRKILMNKVLTNENDLHNYHDHSLRYISLILKERKNMNTK